MYVFDSQADPLNNNDDSSSSAYTLLVLLAGLAVTMYALARFAESKNRLNYESRFARIVAGFLVFMTHALHAKKYDLKLDDAQLIAIGPHRTGLVDALSVAAQKEGEPIRFVATDGFNDKPGVKAGLSKFGTIFVKTNATKGESGQSANSNVIEEVSKVISEEKGCVGLFPQGNLAREGQEPPRVYPGIAKIALQTKVPIHVIRLDGFWSLKNPVIPQFIRNSVAYRALLSALHMNNVRTTLCCVIDFHLKPENKDLSDEEKITEISAQLYAYYRETKELSVEKIDTIGIDISKQTHLLIWKNKVARDNVRKQQTTLDAEKVELENRMLTPMRT